MKINWNNKYTTISVYAFIVLAASIAFYLVLSSLDQFSQMVSGYVSIIYPFIYGFVIAYLVNYPLNFFVNLSKKITRGKESTKYFGSLILAYFFSALLIYLFIAFILPQLIISVTGLIRSIPDYIRSTTDIIDNISAGISLTPEIMNFINDRWVEVADWMNQFATDSISYILFFLRTTAQSFFNLLLGVIISVYMLTEKSRFISMSKKVSYSLFSQKVADRILKISARAHRIFGDFLGGKILDSFIVGIISFVVLSLMNMPYVLLVSFIVAVTNIIPFFGPFIGAIPSFLIIFFESPIQAFWFLIFIIILQQVDGNIIGPKILGDSLGISSFWILFSILISGRIFGFIGMVVGVPLFVLIYSIIKEVLEVRLEEKGLPVETEEYLHK